MSERIASLYAEVTAKTDGVRNGLQDVRGQLTSTGSMFSSFSNAALAAFAAVTAVAGTMAKAFEFGEMGAQIVQVESSFANLLQTLGGAPGTLDAMREAVRGTVTDMELMSSANTLLIGTTGQLGSAFAEALPQLAAIAQAAHDINPELGSTSFLFDSLSRGIKRASPLILDNLGIVVKLEEVYRNYAETLGKTANELTAEEKSMAVLNAVLQEGTTLVEQAAGVNNQAATSFERLRTAAANTGNELKASLAPGLAAAADATYYLLYGVQAVNDALRSHATEVAATSSTYAGYISEVTRAAEVAGYTVNANGDLVESYQDMGYTVEVVVQSHYALSAAEWAAAKSAQGMANATGQLSGGLSLLDNTAAGFTATITDMSGGFSRLGEGELPTLTSALQDQNAEVGASQEAWQAYGERMTAAAEAAGFTAITMDELNIMAAGLAAGLEGTLGTAIESYTVSLGQLQEEQAAIQQQLTTLQEQGFSPTSEKVQELTAALDANKQMQGQALTSLQQLTAETIYNQAAMGLDTQAALDLARSMGVLSETDYAVASAFEALRVEFDANRDGMISAAEGASQYAASVDLVNRAVQSLQAKGLPVTLDNIGKEMADLAGADASGELNATATAADEGAGTLGDFGEQAADAASGADDLTGSVESTGAALKAIMGAASNAKVGLDTVKKAAQQAVTPLSTAADAAVDLDNALSGIPKNTSIRVSTSGFAEAIGWVDDLASAIDGIPRSVTATINVTSTGTGAAPTNNTTGASNPHSQTIISQDVYNISNPLAALILADRKYEMTGKRLEALMNG